jgi:hypothetical protein
MDETLEQLIDAVERDESTQPTRDALMENLYSALADSRLANTWGEHFNVNGVGTYTIICGGVAGKLLCLITSSANTRIGWKMACRRRAELQG